MAKVTQVTNGEVGSSVRSKWNDALQSVEVDGTTITGDGDGTPLVSVHGDISWDSVKTVATSNETLSGLRAISLYTLLENDRILLTAQSDTSENGIYTASTGAWARAADADASDDFIKGRHTYVTEGEYTDSKYNFVSDSYPTIGTNSLSFMGYAAAIDNALAVGDSNLNLTNDAGFLVAGDVVTKQDILTAHQGVILSNNVLSLHRRLTGAGVAGTRPAADTGLGDSGIGEISYLGDDLILSGFGLTESGHTIDGTFTVLSDVHGIIYPDPSTTAGLTFEGKDGGNYPIVDGKDYNVYYKDDGGHWDFVTVTENGAGQVDDWYYFEIDTDPTTLTSSSTGVLMHPVPRYTLDMVLLYAAGDEYYDGTYTKHDSNFAVTYSTGQYRIDTTVTDRAAYYEVFAGTLAVVAWSTDLSQWFVFHTPLTSTTEFVDEQGIGQYDNPTQGVGRRKGFGADTELVDGTYYSSYVYLDYAGTLEYYANVTTGGTAGNEDLAGDGVANNSFLDIEDQATFVITDTVANDNQLALVTSSEVKAYVTGQTLDSFENTWVDVNKTLSSLKGTPTTTLSTTPQSTLTVPIVDGTYGTAKVLIHAVRDDNASVISMEYLVSVHCTSSTVSVGSVQSAITSFGGTQGDLTITFGTSANAIDINAAMGGAEEYTVTTTWNMTV